MLQVPWQTAARLRAHRAFHGSSRGDLRGSLARGLASANPAQTCEIRWVEPGTPPARTIPMRDVRLFVIGHLMLLVVAIVGSIH